MVRVPREYPTHRTERDEWGTQSCGALEWSAKWNVWATRPEHDPSRRISRMLMTDRGSVFSIKQSFRNVVQFLLLFVLSASGTILYAQTVTIKLVNGRNGRAVAQTCAEISTNNRTFAMLITDKDGIASLSLTGDNADHWKDCGIYGVINSVMKYGDSLRIGIDRYLICQPRASDGSRHVIENISTKQVVDQGFVTPNNCGKFTASPKPGELIIFIRPWSFWETIRAAATE
jgi:hypothetical protein